MLKMNNERCPNIPCLKGYTLVNVLKYAEPSIPLLASPAGSAV
jgi:hypothetical protein